MNKKVCVIQDNKSCLRRSSDTLNIKNILLKNGQILLSEKEIEFSDYIIIITCGFNDIARKDGMNLIEIAKKYVKEERILVMGCLPAILPTYFSNTNISYVNPSNYDKLNEILKNLDLISYDIEYANIFKGNYALKQNDIKLADKTYYLNVSTGCLGNCSYCEIKKAIGKLKSFPLEDLIMESKTALSTDINRLYLGADDLGAWGLDIHSSFPILLQTLLKLFEAENKSKCCIDLRNVINPKWIVKYINDLEILFKEFPLNFPTISVAMQSGSQNILQHYNRYNNVDKIFNSLVRLHKANPYLYSFGHMIIGSPLESKTDIMKSLNFIINSPIHFWTCFKFSSITLNDNICTINKNWNFFINELEQKNLNYKLVDGRVYVFKKINKELITINLSK